MQPSELNRRDFGKLAMAALGGLVAGTTALAEDEKKAKEDKKTSKKNPMLFEPHVCRGLNTCKNKGKGKKNDCAGQGDCHTVKAHTCAGDNECRGQGGCKTDPGENACKGKGNCHVPLTDAVWKKARKRFEEVMKKEGNKVGPAPKKKT
jgi:hypothetical protein